MTWRELGWVLCVALVLFAWPLRHGLFYPDRVMFGVDTAAAQLPWSLTPEGSEALVNPELADQGMVFYPAYRFAAREWSLEGPPLWNPLIYAGAPALGNPQLGLLDPQVFLQVLAEKWLGLGAFHWSFALLIWLRLSLAAVGAYALARRLGLEFRGASLCAVGFSSAGFVALWANHSLGHVTSYLPWCLFALEGLRGPRPGRAFFAASVLFAAAIYGGHPETAFNLGLTCGLWSLALARHRLQTGLAALGALACGTLLAAPLLVPFVEYLRNSGALVARQGLAGPTEPDWLALGLCLLVVGVLWRWRELASTDGDRWNLRAWGAGGLIGLCIALLFARAGALGAAAAGGSTSARLFLWPEALGNAATYRGAGQYLEVASPWIAAPIALLALAACFSAAKPAMARRGLCIALGIVALLLALGAPGVSDLYRQLPLIGLAAPVRFSLVSALCLSLLAGEALERAPKIARTAAVSSIAVLALFALCQTRLGPLDESLRKFDPNDGVVEFSARPGRELGAESAVRGWVHPGLAFATAELSVERVPAALPIDAPRSIPVELSQAPLGADRASVEGATHFRASRLWLEHLPEGHWRFRLRLLDEQGALIGDRVVATSSLERRLAPAASSAVYWLCAALFVLGLAPGIPTLALIGFAALQGLGFLHGVHPSVAVERVFPLSATERILARELGTRRYFAEPGVMPANTGMVRGLRAVDGYDGLDPASFDGYRSAVLRPGVQPLVGFNARNAKLESAPFRLLGVGALVLAGPIDAPGFQWIAGPEHGAPEAAECWIYRAVDPLPRAFCVARCVSRESVLANLDAFDPRHSAFLEDGASFTPVQPFGRAEVRELTWGNDDVELEVDLDGEGLLILTEQHFPGWRVEVDGTERELLRANSIFRAVALEAGVHRVAFRYRPRSLVLGLWLALAGIATAAAGSWLLARQCASKP